MRLLLVLCVVTQLVFAQKSATPLDKKVKEFEAYILKAQKEWEVPGMAVVLAKDGKILLSKGFGVKELGTDKMVDAQTLFVCASTTKAMTAACMGMLVDEGKVRWDDPVNKHFPEFQLFDPYVTREIKIRDLLVHDTGVGNADFLWTDMYIPSDEILKKMKDVAPRYSMRSSFIYQNIFYLAAGKVIEKVSEKPWDVFIRERLFQPLGMDRTVPFQRDIKDDNKTSPHYRIEGKITVIQHTNADEIGPAGSVWSCADDMGKWMMCMIDSSKFAGGRLLSASSWTEIFKPQVIVPPAGFYPTMRLTQPNWTTYGYGWYNHDYKGKKVNFHTGSLAGAVAIHAQFPEERLGVYVFANFPAEIRHAIMYKAMDLFAMGGDRDWSADFLKLYSERSAEYNKREADFENARVKGTSPSLSLKAYEGKYTDPLYGELRITVDGNRLLILRNNVSKATLDHWNYDTFRGWFDKRWHGKANAVFSLGADGKIATVTFDGAEFAKSGI